MLGWHQKFPESPYGSEKEVTKSGKAPHRAQQASHGSAQEECPEGHVSAQVSAQDRPQGEAQHAEVGAQDRPQGQQPQGQDRPQGGRRASPDGAGTGTGGDDYARHGRVVGHYGPELDIRVETWGAVTRHGRRGGGLVATMRP
jgi:hypothetical protein